jgi:exodeoxyribonuclease VII large subunit
MATQKSLLDGLLEPRRPLSVSELTGQIKTLLETRFADVWVEGEISNFRPHGSGHWYFTLKDRGAQVSCASFRNQNRYIRFRPEDGMAVRVRGRVSLYEPRGDYQILVSAIEPVGIGALQLAFEQLKARLAAEGLFDAERKRPIPVLPRRVGIVTSPTGAALQDMLRVLGRRNRAVSVLVAPARVQGEGAAEEIAAAIEALDARDDVDVIIVGRGGGSLEDLWPFNEELVARAIAASRVPVVSAVGHETDVTIADFVADLRAPTPSVSAELVARAADDLRAEVEGLRAEARSVVRYRLLAERSRVRALESAPAMRGVPSVVARAMQQADELRRALDDSVAAKLRTLRAGLSARTVALAGAEPRRRSASERARLAALEARLLAATRAAADGRKERLALLSGALSSLSPLGVLLRGYAIVTDARGRVVRTPADVAPGERVLVRVVDGTFTARREDTDESEVSR